MIDPEPSSSKPTAVNPYLSAQEAAEILRTTRRAIYSLIESGRMAKCVRRVGRRLLISRKDLLAFIEQGHTAK